MMKVMPINNLQNNKQQNFKAKFPKQDVQEFLREIENNDFRNAIPKLYTMLDVIKKHPGEKAEIKHIGIWHQILIDGKSVNNDRTYFCATHALHDATVKHKNTMIKQDNSVKRLSEEEYINTYCQNNKKTIQDIQNLFEV